MPHRSVITIHWDERTPPENAQRIAEDVAALVMDRVHHWPRMERTFDSDVSATLWEDYD